MEKWKVLESEKIIDNKWIVVEKQKCDVGDNKIIEDYYIVKKKDYVIIVVEDEGSILFLKQYRHGIGEIILNLPMGLIDEAETPESTAKRELMEETGYHADELIFIGEFFLAPSYINSKAHVFYARGAKKKQEIEIPDIGEKDAILLKISKSELKKLLDKNEIKAMSAITALTMTDKKIGLF